MPCWVGRTEVPMWLLLSACTPREAGPPGPGPVPPQVAPEDLGPVVHVDGAAVPSFSVPLLGGVVAARDPWIGVTDVEADRISFFSYDTPMKADVVDLTGMGADDVRVLNLPSGWAPGPVAWDGDGHLQVLLRGTGELAVADPGEYG